MINIKQFTFNFFGENTYLLYDETKEAVIIDCGCINQQEEDTISGFIEENGLTIKRLLSTHYHFDHVVGNTFICNKYDIKPEMHRGEKNGNTPSLNMQASTFGIPTTFEETEPELFIEENDEINFGNSTLKAILVPGHSPASLAFYSKADGIIFTGDTLFAGSIGRTDLWGGDYDKLISGIRGKLITLPDSTVIYPGHGPASTVASEKSNNPFLR